MTVTITVTQAHIDAAFHRNAEYDPIALAILDAIPGATRPRVDTFTIGWTDERGVWHTFATPAAARDAIFSYDGGEKPEPFSFELSKGVAAKDRYARPPP